MSAVTINGVDLQAQLDTLRVDTETIGAAGVRASDASLRDNVQAQLLKASGTSIIVTRAESLFLRALLLRQRDSWRWASDLYSDKGVSASASSGATVGNGNGQELDLAGSTGTVTYPRTNRRVGLTVAVGVDTDGAGFNDWIVAFDEAGNISGLYKDGASQYASVPAWFVYGSLFFKLQSATAHIHKFSDLEVIPAALQSSQVAGLAAFRAANANWNGSDGIPLAPDLWVDGLWPTTIIMQGDLSQSPMVAASVGGSYAADNVQLSFSLRQVKPDA